MKSEITLIVEDNKPQRLSLQEALRNRGFRVESAGDVRTARALIKKHRDKLDVLVLDMRLEDPGFPDKTGADLGIELLETKPERPPEFLINSAYANLSYYSLSLELGAAAYLDKNEYSPKQLIYHILALKLRRILTSFEVLEQVQRISDTSKDNVEIVTRLCKEVLETRLKELLRVPVIFLLSDNGHTQCCAGQGILPERDDPIYGIIQSVIFSEVRDVEPFVIDIGKLPHHDGLQEGTILTQLSGAVFLPLRLNSDFYLSIGLLAQHPSEFPLASDAKEMAIVLGQYHRASVLNLYSYALSLKVRSEIMRREKLRSTSEFCFYVGQELLATLQQASYSHDALTQRELFDQLRTQATVLRDSGKTLMELSRQMEAPGGSKELDWEYVPVAELVREVGDDLLLLEQLKIEVDCDIQVEREDLLIILTRLLGWFAGRPDIEGVISVTSRKAERDVELIFEDHSPRLNKALRARLFYPFSHCEKDAQNIASSLYLVKMLVEVKYDGKLVDQTDDLPNEIGHRFVICLPQPNR